MWLKKVLALLGIVLILVAGFPNLQFFTRSSALTYNIASSFDVCSDFSGNLTDNECPLNIVVYSNSLLWVGLGSYKSSSQGCPSTTISDSRLDSYNTEGSNCESGGAAKNEGRLAYVSIATGGSITITCADLNNALAVYCFAFDVQNANISTLSATNNFGNPDYCTTPAVTANVVTFNWCTTVSSEGTGAWSGDSNYTVINNAASTGDSQDIEYCIGCSGSFTGSGHAYSEFALNPVSMSVSFSAQPTTTGITFAESGLPNPMSQSYMLALNQSVYQVANMPVTFNYGENNLSNILSYGYFQSVDGYSLSSVSSTCIITKENAIIIPLFTGPCTFTGNYVGAPTPQYSIVNVAVNDIVATIIFLIPSLTIIFIFLYIGRRMFNLGGDALFFLMIFAIAALAGVGALMKNTFVPVWAGAITIVLMSVGFVWNKNRGGSSDQGSYE